MVVVQVSNWPAQCSPLSTLFDLVKLVDEESVRATQGRRDHPILVLDRWEMELELQKSFISL